MYEDNNGINDSLQNKYSLVKCERHFKNKTLVSFYNTRNFAVKKKYKPFDYNGHRYRLNLETGELEYYDMKTCMYIRGCSVRRTKILLGMLLEMNKFDYFCTFTFDRLRIDRNNEKQVYDAYKKFANNLKHRFPNLKYITVPERHKVKIKIEDIDVDFEIDMEVINGAIHFHMLLALNGHSLSELGFEKTTKVCCSWATKKNGICDISYFEKTKHLHELKPTDGLSIFHIKNFRYGYTTASRIVSEEACKTYVKKYISKSLGISTSEFKKRFYYTKNLDVPLIVKKEIGDGFETPVSLRNNTEIPELQQFNEVYENNEDVFSHYNKEYNVLQYWFENDKYNDFETVRHTGIIPTTHKTPFDEEQIDVKTIAKNDNKNTTSFKVLGE